MDIRSSNGVLESLLRTVMLRKLAEQNRTGMLRNKANLRIKHTNVATFRTSEDKVNILHSLIQTNNDSGPTAGCFV